MRKKLTMESDTAKIFVGGLSKDTSEDNLKEYFGKYGVVENCLVATDKLTKASRGFGFVWFADASCAAKTLQDSHMILGKLVDVKKAIPRGEQQAEPNGVARNKKIFIGGLSSSLTQDQLKSYFEGFGRIVDVVVMQDRFTKHPRGFGFVTFDCEDAVDKAMQNTFHDLNGRSVEVKRAVPKYGIIGHNGDNYMYKNGVNGSFFDRSRPRYYTPYGPEYHHLLFSYAPYYVYGTDMYNGGYAVVLGNPAFRYYPFVQGNRWSGPVFHGNVPYPSYNTYYTYGSNFRDLNTMAYNARVENLKISEVDGDVNVQNDESKQPVNEAKFEVVSSAVNGGNDEAENGS